MASEVVPVQNSVVQKQSRMVPTFGGKPISAEGRRTIPQLAPPQYKKATQVLFDSLEMPEFEKEVAAKQSCFALFKKPSEETSVVQMTRSELLRSYPAVAEKIQAWPKEMEQFFRAIIKSNLSLRNIRVEGSWLEENIGRLIQKAGLTLRVPSPPLLRAEDAMQPPKVIYDLIHTSVMNACTALADQVMGGLQLLRNAEQVGGISYPAADKSVATYFFYRWVITDTFIEERQRFNLTSDVRSRETVFTRTTTTEQDIDRQFDQELHQHDIIEVKREPLTFAALRSLYAPRRVKEMVSEMPVWARQLAQAVSGDEIFRSVMQRTLAKERRTETSQKVDTEVRRNVFHHDPCIVIGNAVLTGWDSTE